MTAPKRIQLRRTKGWRKPEGAIVVARPSKWGNPFRVGDDAVAFIEGDTSTVVHVKLTAAAAVLMFRGWVERTDMAPSIRAELAGHDLACWCPLEDALGNRVPCHADVLLEIANQETQ